MTDERRSGAPVNRVTPRSCKRVCAGLLAMFLPCARASLGRLRSAWRLGALDPASNPQHPSPSPQRIGYHARASYVRWVLCRPSMIYPFSLLEPLLASRRCIAADASSNRWLLDQQVLSQRAIATVVFYATHARRTVAGQSTPVRRGVSRLLMSADPTTACFAAAAAAYPLDAVLGLIRSLSTGALGWHQINRAMAISPVMQKQSPVQLGHRKLSLSADVVICSCQA
jgi:hypothetical protein